MYVASFIYVWGILSEENSSRFRNVVYVYVNMSVFVHVYVYA
jgi:hypothetical protein